MFDQDEVRLRGVRAREHADWVAGLIVAVAEEALVIASTRGMSSSEFIEVRAFDSAKSHICDA